MKRMLVWFSLLISVVAVAVAVVSGGECNNDGSVLVLATHPDDEVICCAGVISRAVSLGRCVRVVVITNGELYGDGISRGLERERESIAGIGKFGLTEDDIVFLGYPDSYLLSMMNDYNRNDSCLFTNRGVSATFGAHGRGRADYRFSKTGTHACYNYPNLLSDISNAVAEFKPAHIFVSASAVDTHRDHIVTFEAAMTAITKEIAPNALVHHTIVWNSDKAWPNHIDPSSRIKSPMIPQQVITSLPYMRTEERFATPVSMATTNWKTNSKYQAIEAHDTQEGTRCSFLMRFLHRDEVFWVRSLDPAVIPPIVSAGDDQTACQGQVVTLDGTKSEHPGALAFSWVQTAGAPVRLSDPATAKPSFVAPNRECTLEFALSVKTKEGVTSFTDSVAVRVLPPNTMRYGENVAPKAKVKVSTESFPERATGAIDGKVDGLLRKSPTEVGDQTAEWKTQSEDVGSWIELSWETPVKIGKVVLHDSVNCHSHIRGGRLTFSDGTAIDVGELDNAGAATVVEFAPRTVTSLMFTVTAAFVNRWPRHIGLAEMLVYPALDDPLCPSGGAQLPHQEEFRDDDKFLPPLSAVANTVFPVAAPIQGMGYAASITLVCISAIGIALAAWHFRLSIARVACPNTIQDHTHDV